MAIMGDQPRRVDAAGADGLLDTADDFQTDPLGLYLGGVDVYMNNHIGNYDAHIFSWALSYEF